jgi:hypothetical protein
MQKTLVIDTIDIHWLDNPIGKGDSDSFSEICINSVGDFFRCHFVDATAGAG